MDIFFLWLSLVFIQDYMYAPQDTLYLINPIFFQTNGEIENKTKAIHLLVGFCIYLFYFFCFISKMKTVYYWYKTFANVYTCKYACRLYKIMFTNLVRGGFIIMVLKLEQSSIYYSSDLKKRRINQFIQFWFIQNVTDFMLPRDHDVNKIFTFENLLIETIKIDQII